MKLSPFHQLAVCWMIWLFGLLSGSAAVIGALDRRTGYDYNQAIHSDDSRIGFERKGQEIILAL